MKYRKISFPTPESLDAAALRYLARYAASEASLRRVLENRIQRALLRLPQNAADHERLDLLRTKIGQIVEKHKKTGTINDASFSEMKIRSLRRQGRSGRAIAQKLYAKGIAKSLIDLTLKQTREEDSSEGCDLKAARILARRKKMGPFRKEPSDERLRRKDFSALARAGFSSSIAKRVLETEPPEDWE